MQNVKTIHLVLILGFIILVAPFIFTMPFFWDRFNYSITGQIGDTIGGITAPIVNGIAAILVFITFREQVRANNLLQGQETSLRNQEQSRNIIEQINAIGNNKIKIESEVGEILGLENRLFNEEGHKAATRVHLNRIFYFISEFDLAIDLIEEFKGDKNYLYRKLNYLYQIRFSVHLDLLYRKLLPIHNIEHNLHSGTMFEIVKEKERLDEYFENPNRYQNQP